MSRHEHQGRTELHRAANKRLRDAEVLLAAGREHAACATYIAGYAVECRLKAVALETFGCWTLTQLAAKWHVDERKVFVHGLEVLFKNLPCYNRFRNSEAWQPFARTVNLWRPSWRYSASVVEVDTAQAFLEDVKSVLAWLGKNA